MKRLTLTLTRVKINEKNLPKRLIEIHFESVIIQNGFVTQVKQYYLDLPCCVLSVKFRFKSFCTKTNRIVQVQVVLQLGCRLTFPPAISWLAPHASLNSQLFQQLYCDINTIITSLEECTEQLFIKLSTTTLFRLVNSLIEFVT